MSVKCPKCSQLLDISGLDGGTVIQCPCGAKLRTPATNQSPQQPAQQSPIQPNPALNSSQPAPLSAHPQDPLAQQAPLTAQDPLAAQAPLQQMPLQQPVPQSQMPYQPTGFSPAPGYPPPAGYPATAPQNDDRNGLGFTTKQRFQLVNHAVRLVFFGTIGMICGYIVMFFNIGGIPIIGSIVSLAAVASKTAIVVGYVMSLYAPPESKTKGYLIAALIVNVSGGLVIDIAVFIMQTVSIELGLKLLSFLMLIGFVMPVASVAIYLFFLRALSLYTGANDAAQSAGEIAFHLIILTAIQFVLGSVSASLALPGFVLTVIGIAYLIAYVQWLIRYLQFLDSLHFRKKVKSSSTQSTGGGWGSQR